MHINFCIVGLQPLKLAYHLIIYIYIHIFFKISIVPINFCLGNFMEQKCHWSSLFQKKIYASYHIDQVILVYDGWAYRTKESTTLNVGYWQLILIKFFLTASLDMHHSILRKLFWSKMVERTYKGKHDS